jgi:hypothetical protein
MSSVTRRNSVNRNRFDVKARDASLRIEDAASRAGNQPRSGRLHAQTV